MLHRDFCRRRDDVTVLVAKDCLIRRVSMALNLFSIDIRLENDVVLARQKARTIAAALKFDPQDQTRIATAVSEIARNTFQYGGRRQGGIHASKTSPEKMLLITLRDKGRGIRTSTRSWAASMYLKLVWVWDLLGAKRLMDHFKIETHARQGTTVILGKNVPRGFSRFKPGELDKVLSASNAPHKIPIEELKQQNQELLKTLQELRCPAGRTGKSQPRTGRDKSRSRRSIRRTQR